jgi:hypothetical protein
MVGKRNRKLRSYIGVRSRRLKVLRDADDIFSKNGIRIRRVECYCDCGRTIVVRLANIISKHAGSCGCIDVEKLHEIRLAKYMPQRWFIGGDIASIIIDGYMIIIDKDDVSLVESTRWHLDAQGYVVDPKSRSLHRTILGLPVGDPREGDHIHHSLLDNRKSQLRIVSRLQNVVNTRKNKKSKMKFKGIVMRPGGKFKAQISSNGIRYYSDSFDDQKSAAIAYDDLARLHHGKNAFLNFPYEVV